MPQQPSRCWLASHPGSPPAHHFIHHVFADDSHAGIQQCLQQAFRRAHEQWCSGNEATQTAAAWEGELSSYAVLDMFMPSACLTCTAAACCSAAGWVASQAGLPLEQWVPATAKQSFTTAVSPCGVATHRGAALMHTQSTICTQRYWQGRRRHYRPAMCQADAQTCKRTCSGPLGAPSTCTSPM